MEATHYGNPIMRRFDSLYRAWTGQDWMLVLTAVAMAAASPALGMYGLHGRLLYVEAWIVGFVAANFALYVATGRNLYRWIVIDLLVVQGICFFG